MTTSLPDVDGVSANVDRLAAELGVPRWFVRRHIGVFVCGFAAPRVFVTVDFCEKTGPRKFADPEDALRLAARHIELGDRDESTYEEWRWKSDVLAAAPEFGFDIRRDLYQKKDRGLAAPGARVPLGLASHEAASGASAARPRWTEQPLSLAYFAAGMSTATALAVGVLVGREFFK